MEWMIMPIKRYADFSGRSRRMEFWMFTLFYWMLLIAAILVSIIIGMTIDPNNSDLAAGFMVGLVGIIVLALFVPSLAVQVRRFHDQDKSGWLVLLGFIPYVGGLIVLVFMCIDGTRGDNQYGPDPKGGYDTNVFE